MSRFDQGRWSRVVVWTGAALAWGSALVAARLEPGGEAAPEPVPASTQVGVESGAAFPVPPRAGIVVIRQTGATDPSSAVVPAQAVEPQPSPAPAPVSSGS